MTPLNVLLSSAGRRVGLLRCFQQSLADLGMSGSLHAADCSRSAPAFHLADRSWLVPRCRETGFTAAVLAIASAANIRLIVPTIDTELPAYAAARREFEAAGVLVSVSAPETVDICADKALTNSWLTRHGFPTVRQSTPAEVLANPAAWPFPLLVKPRRGSASIGVRTVESPAALALLAEAQSELVVEEIAPGQEHTINVFVDRQGRCRCAVPHRRLEVRAGEVSKGLTVKHRGMMELARQIAEKLPGAFGALNIQCFLGPDGAIRVIELNARFGGGYPLAHQAGAHFTRWLIEETLGLPLTADFDAWQDDLAMLRFDDAVFVPGSRIRE